MHSCSDNDIDLNVVKIKLGSKELATTLKARLKFSEKKSLFNCCSKFFHRDQRHRFFKKKFNRQPGAIKKRNKIKIDCCLTSVH